MDLDGNPALADQEDILDFPYLSDPEWKGTYWCSYLHYDANWMLIVDNLADFRIWLLFIPYIGWIRRLYRRV